MKNLEFFISTLSFVLTVSDKKKLLRRLDRIINDLQTLTLAQINESNEVTIQVIG